MANKKINQLVSKTSILSTDIFGIGDASTGQLYKKTIAELQAAIGGAVISVNGLVGTVVLNTDNIQEAASPTNKYFTDARARSAHSLTVTGASGAATYSSGTGVLNVPTYTLAGLGGIAAVFLSGTSGISYNSTTGVISYSGTVYTDASVRALLSAGTGITYNNTTGVITSAITQYTDALARAAISLTVTGSSGASTYSNSTGVLNVPTYTLAGLGGQPLATNLTSLSGLTYVSASFVKMTASGTFSLDTSVYLTSITSGNVTTALGFTPYNATNPNGYTSNVGTVTSVSALTLGTTGTDLSSSVATGTVTPVITLNVPNASAANRGALLAADWSTFNSKQGAIALTTTGTSGAATFSSNTLNIPNYGSALSGYLPLTGGTLTGSLTASAGVISQYSKSTGRIFSTGDADYGDLASTTGAIVMSYDSTNQEGVLSTRNYSASANKPLTISGSIIKLSTGNVLINTTTDSGYKLDVNGTGRFSGALTGTNFYSTGASNFATSSGNVLIGTTTDGGYKLYVSGSIYATGTIVSLSDERFKKNLAIIENPIDKLMKLNGYTYQMKSDDSFHYGVIAQELEGVLPYAVSETDQGVKGVEYNQIIPVLIEAIKEQNAKISNLETILASK